MLLKLDMIQTVALAVIVLFLGQGIKRKVNILERYFIPAPVIGGVLFALIALVLKQTGTLTFEMDVTLQEIFMIAFFTTIGFTASLKLLKKGGLQVLIFLAISIILVVLQNILGIGLTKLFNLNELIGLCVGSVPLVGGPATAGAFGPVFERAGADGATTVAIAAATFGLVFGSIIGGPIAKRLIEKNNLVTPKKQIGNLSEEETAATLELSAPSELIPERFMTASAQILIAMGLGTIISELLQKTGMTFPPYIGAMFAAAIIRNICDYTEKYTIVEEEVEILGNIALSLFLSMALMGLKLWQLAGLALPLIIMLIVQTVLMILFAYYVCFNIMGRDYEAAVIASGMCGFGMGATPNAMANMEAISKNFGPAPRAFFIVPIVGSLFIDFINAGFITFFMNFLTK